MVVELSCTAPRMFGQIMSSLFYDYRTNAGAYPKWQAWMRETFFVSCAHAALRRQGEVPRWNDSNVH